MEWSDIRVFLQVARAGTMAAATGALRMDHSTISRRIFRLERDAGVPLFKRAGRRVALTAEGEKLVLAAEKLESIIICEVMSLSGDRERINGHVRIGATEEFGAHYLAWRLAELTAMHPGLEIELVALPQTFSLAAREVDVLVTLDRPHTGDVRFKKLIEFQNGLYGSAAYFSRRKRPAKMEELALETWCGYIKELLFTSEFDVMSNATDNFSAKFRTTNVSVRLAAALSGYALAALPCFVAAEHPVLERILPGNAVFEQTYWLAVHEDLAKHPRVRVVMNAIEALVERDRLLFKPEATVPSALLKSPFAHIADAQLSTLTDLHENLASSSRYPS